MRTVWVFGDQLDRRIGALGERLVFERRDNLTAEFRRDGSIVRAFCRGVGKRPVSYRRRAGRFEDEVGSHRARRQREQAEKCGRSG